MLFNKYVKTINERSCIHELAQTVCGTCDEINHLQTSHQLQTVGESLSTFVQKSKVNDHLRTINVCELKETVCNLDTIRTKWYEPSNGEDSFKQRVAIKCNQGHSEEDYVFVHFFIRLLKILYLSYALKVLLIKKKNQKIYIFWQTDMFVTDCLILSCLEHF